MPSFIRKKFINEPENVVSDALKGLVAANELVQFHPYNPRIIIRRDVCQLQKASKVTFVAGGGSGHEPFAAGYVGHNGVTAAICGEIFASPPSTYVTDGVEAVYSDAGTLIYVINYTGDRLHFGMAAERLKASRNQTKIDLVYIDDDVALESQAGGTTGRRGLAGAAFTLQIAGVMAEQENASFEAVRDMSRQVIDNLGTFGVSLYACALPGKSYMFELGDDQLELGLGIHGESGCERRKQVSAKELVELALPKLVDSQRLSLQKGEQICLLLNNLGGVSQLELNIVQGEALGWLILHGYNVQRFVSGAVMTSVDGYGISFTILKVKNPKWIEYLDADSVLARNWKITKPAAQLETPSKTQSSTHKRCTMEITAPGVHVSQTTADSIKACVLKACKVIEENEKLLNELDAECGDGDCGVSLKSAAKAIQVATLNDELDYSKPKILSLKLSQLFEDSIGGTSGALYALFFGSASACFEKTFTENDIKNALEQGLNSIMYYGHAKPGYRTLVDPLSTAVGNKDKDWKHIVETVEQAAEATAKMRAKSGRASYTSAEQQQKVDPGAKAIALWFRVAYDEYTKFGRSVEK